MHDERVFSGRQMCADLDSRTGIAFRLDPDQCHSSRFRVCPIPCLPPPDIGFDPNLSVSPSQVSRVVRSPSLAGSGCVWEVINLPSLLRSLSPIGTPTRAGRSRTPKSPSTRPPASFQSSQRRRPPAPVSDQSSGLVDECTSLIRKRVRPGPYSRHIAVVVLRGRGVCY